MADADNIKQYEKKDRKKAAKLEADNIASACTYTAHIKEDLAEFYEDPLKKKFIETTYY
jgi:hypothetical protein